MTKEKIMRKILLLILGLYLGGMIMSSALDKADVFKVLSPVIKNNTEMPNALVYNGYGCTGGNKAPELNWVNAPENTKSFAIVCHDPDAPHENGWYHWLMVNIPKDINSYKNKLPEGALETITDFGATGYGGACPPRGHGVHRYNFTVFALDSDKLDVSKATRPKEVHDKILNHTIAKSTITVTYERN